MPFPMEVSSSSIHAPSLPLCNRRLSVFPSSSSSLQISLCSRLTIRCPPCHKAVSTNLISFTQNALLCNPRKNMAAPPRHYSFPKEFAQQHCDYELHKLDRLARHTVVKCELVGAGMADAAYPLSEDTLGSKVRGIFFYAVTAIAAIFLIVPMLVQHPLVLLVDRYRRKAQYFIAKIWATLTVTPFLKIEFEGLENLLPPDTPAVYVSNHQSFLDIYTLLTLGRSFKFISKTSIFLYPIIGWAMSMMGVIPLKRMDSRSQVECLKRCIDLVRKGSSVLFFPEGTRSKDGKLGVFKKGAFSVAAKTGVPVIPMTLLGTGKIMPAGKEGILNVGSVKVVVHKPIEGNDAMVLCSEARKAIADVLDQQG